MVVLMLEIVTLLDKYFKSDENIALWLNTENFNFGGSKPITLIAKGRGHKVLNYIKIALEENEP